MKFFLVKSFSTVHDSGAMILRTSDITQVNCFTMTVKGKKLYFVSARTENDRRGVSAHDHESGAKLYLQDLLEACGEEKENAQELAEEFTFEDNDDDEEEEKNFGEKVKKLLKAL